jgi:hypothetical protein
MRSGHFPSATAISVFGFAVGGAVSRYSLQTTETRWQIAAFAVLAAGVEMAARSSEPDRASAMRGTLNAAAASMAIISVKLYLEPSARERGGMIARQLAATIAGAITGMP